MPAFLRSGRLGWLLLSLVTSAVIHYRQMLGEHLYIRDLHRMFVPAKHFMAESFRRGELPQWWPYDGAGTPFLSQSLFSVFHPTSIFYAVLPFWNAFVLQDFAGTWLGLTGTFLLVRRLKGSPQAASIAAVVYAANGYFTSVREFPFTHLALATVPWYVWALLKAGASRGAWRIAPALVMGSMLLAGDPQVSLLAAFAGLVVLLAVQGVSRETTLLAVLSPLVGAGLAAIQLMPSMEALAETDRAVPMREANQWPLTPGNIAAFLVPTAFGTNAFVDSNFIGWAAFALVLASLACLRDRRVWPFWLLFVVAFWLALGDGYGLNNFARKVVPLWGSFRYPIKSVALLLLAASLLAAVGYDFLRGASKFRWKTAVAVLAISALAMAGARTIWAPSEQPTLWWVLLGVSGLALLLPPRRAVAGWLVVVLFAAPMLWFSGRLLRTKPLSYYDEPPFAQLLRSAGVGLDGSYFIRIGVDESNDYLRHEGYTVTAGGSGGGLASMLHLPSLLYYTPGASSRLMTLFIYARGSNEHQAWMAGLFGTGVLVVPPELTRWPILGQEEKFGLRAARNTYALPRAYAAHRATATPDFEQVFERLQYTRLEADSEILIEAEPNPEWSGRELRPIVPLRVKHHSPTHVTVEGNVPWPGFAVLNETAATGWTATVDGEPVEWFVANGLVRAVEVSEGTHRIEWTYETPGLRLGAAISLSTLVLALLAMWLIRKKNAPIPVG